MNKFKAGKFASAQCIPCEGIETLPPEKVAKLLGQMQGWLSKTDSIEKEFRFKSYLDGLEFAQRIGTVSEQQNHHPNILIRWKRVRVNWSTHSINGLSQNDFIMAAKTDLEFSNLEKRRDTESRQAQNRKIE